MTNNAAYPDLPAPYAKLAEDCGERALAALAGAVAEGTDPAEALMAAGVPKRDILEALAAHYGVDWVAYDERMSIPPELVADIDYAMLADGRWFPLAWCGDDIIVAAPEPGEAKTVASIDDHFHGLNIVWRVALRRDVRWFVEGFLRRASGGQIGTERTYLAFWRNTMAHWRTKMACYRTDMAKARTCLNVMRWGLGLVALADTLMRTRAPGSPEWCCWLLLTAGLIIAGSCFWGYLQVRRPHLAPPAIQTLVEVTSATIQFLEDFHFLECRLPQPGPRPLGKPTMLARLADFLVGHSTILTATSGARVRIHLARERNVLAAQRTVNGCTRTIAARARTGLALLRTGVTVACLGLGLIKYFGLSQLTAFDSLLVLAGVFMTVDGMRWYWPVRRERFETPRCIEWGGDED